MNMRDFGKDGKLTKAAERRLKKSLVNRSLVEEDLYKRRDQITEDEFAHAFARATNLQWMLENRELVCIMSNFGREVISLSIRQDITSNTVIDCVTLNSCLNSYMANHLFRIEWRIINRKLSCLYGMIVKEKLEEFKALMNFISFPFEYDYWSRIDWSRFLVFSDFFKESFDKYGKCPYCNSNLIESRISFNCSNCSASLDLRNRFIKR